MRDFIHFQQLKRRNSEEEEETGGKRECRRWAWWADTAWPSAALVAEGWGCQVGSPAAAHAECSAVQGPGVALGGLRGEGKPKPVALLSSGCRMLGVQVWQGVARPAAAQDVGVCVHSVPKSCPLLPA